MTPRLAVLSLLAITLLEPCWANAQIKQPDEAAEVQRLFHALSDDQWKMREDARKQLIDRGESVLPQLKKLADRSQDPETRSVTAIEAAVAGTIDRATLIMLDVTGASPQDALREVARQTRIEIPIWPDNAFARDPLDRQKVTLKVKRQPFWQVPFEFKDLPLP